MNDRDRKLAMDACRPGSDDLQSEELGFLAEMLESDADLRREFDSIGHSDRRLAAQLGEVRLPDDLQHRVMDRLRLNQELTGALTSSVWLSRRRWILAGCGLAVTAAAVVLIVTFLGPSKLDGITAQQLARAALSDWELSDAWSPLGTEDRDTLYPLSRALRQTPTRWQVVETSLDKHALVYDFEQMPVLTRLFVLRVTGRLKQVPVRPQPVPESKGRVTAVWQSGDYVYVLTVIGTIQDFNEVVRQQSPELVIRRRPSHLS